MEKSMARRRPIIPTGGRGGSSCLRRLLRPTAPCSMLMCVLLLCFLLLSNIAHFSSIDGSIVVNRSPSFGGQHSVDRYSLDEAPMADR